MLQVRRLPGLFCISGQVAGIRTDEVEFRQENCPVGSFQEFARRLQPEGSDSRERGRSPATPTKEERGFQVLCFA